MSLTALSFFCIDTKKQRDIVTKKNHFLDTFFQSKIYLMLVIERIFYIFNHMWYVQSLKLTQSLTLFIRGAFITNNAYAIYALSIIKWK